MVLDPGDEAPVMLLEHEPGGVQQAQRRLDEAALVRDGEAEALPHFSPLAVFGVVPSAALKRSSIPR